MTRALVLTATLVAPGCPPPDPGTSSTSDADSSGGSEGAPTSGSASTSLDEPTAPDVTGTTDAPASSTGAPDSSTSTSGTSDTSSTSGTSSTGEPGVCGDGAVDPGEDCDDGNAAGDDGCLADCQFGPGAKISTLTPPTLAGESLVCFTQVREQFLDGGADALVIGGKLKDFAPDNVYGARVWQTPLPEAMAASWSFADDADPHSRFVVRAVTADNGDTVVAGIVSTEQLKPDSGGHLWLARFAPTGALLWSHDLEQQNLNPLGLQLTPTGDIVVAGHCLGWCTGAAVVKFDPGGAQLWEEHAPFMVGIGTGYTAVTIDAAGVIYVAGERYGDGFSRLLVRAHQPDGALIWETELEQPPAPFLWTGGLVLTGDDTLVVAVTQSDADHMPLEAMGLAAFDTAGDPLWWKEWTAPQPGWVRPVRMLASDDGGFHLIGQHRTGHETTGSVVARFDGEGEAVWANVTLGEHTPNDLLLGVDGMLYVLNETTIDLHLP